MPQNKTKESKDMKQKILDESIRLFGKNGFDGTSIQQIADAVGIKKPSLIYYFHSKEELRLKVYEELVNHWKDKLPELLAASSGEHDRFYSVITALVDYFKEDPNRARLAIREMLDRPESVKQIIQDQLSPWMKLVTDYIYMGKRFKVVKEDVDPESYIIQVIIMTIGTVALSSSFSSMFKNDYDETLSLLIKEMVRMTRSSLLTKTENKQLKPEV